jgi:hypothetical protein
MGIFKVDRLRIESNCIVYNVCNNNNKILLLSPMPSILTKDLIFMTTILKPFEKEIICKTNEYQLLWYNEMGIIDEKKTANNAQHYNNIYHTGDELVSFYCLMEEKKSNGQEQNTNRQFKLLL